MITRLRKESHDLVKSLLGNGSPLIIFQMGSVGSCTLLETLTPVWKGFVAHAHTKAMMSTFLRLRLESWLRRQSPIYVLSPVREVISRNISAFFQNFVRDTGKIFVEGKYDICQLRNLFLTHYPHHVCLNWVDTHLKPTFGIDIYAEPFPSEKGYKIYRSNGVNLLVYQAELENDQKLSILSHFLSMNIPDFKFDNLGTEKYYSKTYAEFRKRVRFPNDFVNQMLRSRFSNHFYTSTQIERSIARWSELPEADESDAVS